MKIKTELQKDSLSVKIYSTRREMGESAAFMVAETICTLLDERERISMIFAAAPSQNEFLEALIAQPGIDWQRVIAFHMDEYIGLPADAPQGFGNFLKERIFDKVPFHEVHYLNGLADDPQQECVRYTELLNGFQPDIVCMGIGENTHIAFNDPHVANFNDPETVKVVDLDLSCRQQQVNDGCFTAIEEVPTHALTLTVPTLMRPASVFCMVPGLTKAWAVQKTLTQTVDQNYPSTALRQHPKAILFLDGESASLLNE
ncbi:glucosamine-6-phosphate deaminase [Maribellus sp. YY47]|uniref:glucosamine-6-phosphate deaminase n=1 Tax=Maribellus sp. YY47 TaxID=2929486 RepID=UPI002000DA0A|nr:glucosamine-6-phosphate deaminase [Maribellus sp. YY47]MCK3683872.1 glucosamine-6-phosphate deaminase [Maribellus sp. YY47]